MKDFEIKVYRGQGFHWPKNSGDGFSVFFSHEKTPTLYILLWKIKGKKVKATTYVLNLGTLIQRRKEFRVPYLPSDRKCKRILSKCFLRSFGTHTPYMLVF